MATLKQRSARASVGWMDVSAGHDFCLGALRGRVSAAGREGALSVLQPWAQKRKWERHIGSFAAGGQGWFAQCCIDASMPL